jgi:CDGSH-type Zn-finger protein
MPDAGEADTIAAVVESCPSGALQYRRLDGGAQETHRGSATVTPVRDGPLMVVGEIVVTRDDGRVEVLPRATLCRCGESLHKPFCDNQHLRTGFKAPGAKIKIHLTPVRSAPDKPITKAEDPRRVD